MKKFYYVYEIKEDWGEKFAYKAFSEHSAIEWVREQLTRPKHKGSKFKIQPIYKEGVLFPKDENN